MRVSEHGGGCCGSRHLRQFGNSPTPAFLTVLDNYIEQFQTGNQEGTGRRNNRMLEVILTDNQCLNGWPRELRNRGFKRMARWLNSNSGNVCNLFLLFHEDTSRAPYEWPALPQEHRGRYRQRARRT